MIWDVGSGKALHTLPTRGGHLSGLATAGFELTRGFGQLKLWDVASGKELRGILSDARPPHGNRRQKPERAAHKDVGRERSNAITQLVEQDN